jgi:hypothetical protein
MNKIWKEVLNEPAVNYASRNFPDDLNEDLNKAYELQETLKNTLLNIKLKCSEQKENNTEIFEFFQRKGL